MDENQKDKNRIGQKQDWTKSFGPKPVGQKGVGRKLGARGIITNLRAIRRSSGIRIRLVPSTFHAWKNW